MIALLVGMAIFGMSLPLYFHVLWKASEYGDPDGSDVAFTMCASAFASGATALLAIFIAVAPIVTILIIAGTAIPIGAAFLIYKLLCAKYLNRD